jgi:DNA-binding transcriptional regulator PaaX
MSSQNSKQRLGKQEMALLEEISMGDAIFGFLTSGGSTTIANRQARRRAKRRADIAQEQALRNRLVGLEKKNLIKLEATHDGQQRAYLTDQGKAHAAKQTLVKQYAQYQKDFNWDGIWRIVMFDIPQERKAYRWELRHLLQECGFIQVQQSVYAAPYPCKELREYIARNRMIGSYVHIIKGEYVGDDTHLHKEFGLTV